MRLTVRPNGIRPLHKLRIYIVCNEMGTHEMKNNVNARGVHCTYYLYPSVYIVI